MLRDTAISNSTLSMLTAKKNRYALPKQKDLTGCRYLRLMDNTLPGPATVHPIKKATFFMANGITKKRWRAWG